MVQVRYIVTDVEAAIAFYCQHLGFHEDPSGNPIELFEPTIPEARLSPGSHPTAK